MTSDGLYTIGSFAFIVDDEDRVLLSHRRDLNLWNMPGGPVRVDELPNAAAVREVNEETGLDVETTRLVGVYGRTDGKADLVFVFGCKVLGGELMTTEEADEHAWFPLEEIPANTIPKQVRRIEDGYRRLDAPIFRVLTDPSSREHLADPETTP